MVIANGKVFGNARFNNDEVIYRSDSINGDVNVIELVFKNNEDLFNLQFAVEYISQECKDAEIRLIMKYVPYSRMDREIHDQIFSLKILASIINKMGFSTVEVLDPHSEVVTNLIERVELIDINKYTDVAIKSFKPNVIMFPDEGAYKKYPKILKEREGIHYIHAIKERNIENGRIDDSKYKVISGDVEIKGANVLIIDDICCFGGTFMLAASTLKKMGASRIGLYVSHCERAIFKGSLLGSDSGVSKVYTTNSTGLLEEISIRRNDDGAYKEKLIVIQEEV